MLYLCQLLNCSFLFLLFQFLNTRSQKGDKAKDQGLEEDKNSDLDQDASEADLSLMDRTRRQVKSARDNLKKNSKALSSYEEEALDLEELLTQSRQKAEACLLYTSPSPRDRQKSRMPSSA